MIFTDRFEAGRMLAERILALQLQDPLVIALPRGGVPIGYEIARKLKTPLTVLVVRKIGSPSNREFGIGALSENNVLILDKRLIEKLNISQKQLKDIVEDEKKELKRRVKLYRGGIRLPSLKGRTVILVDDGLATGVTAKAAIEAVRKKHPKEVLFTSPVCAHDTSEELREKIDALICLTLPLNLEAIGMYYQNFSQLSDREVLDLLKLGK